MSSSIVELRTEEVIGLNRRVIEFARREDPACKQLHGVRSQAGLSGCVGGVFYQTGGAGYINLPLEKMAGLLLFRIAQGQFFLDGNKRTAFYSMVVFLGNNGNNVRTEQSVLSDLIWGFATGPNGKPKYTEDDAVQFVFDNIIP